MGVWAVEMAGYDTVAAADTTAAFVMGRGELLADKGYLVGALVSWKSFSQKVTVSSSGPVQISADSGTFTIANQPEDTASAGPLDSLLKVIWQNRLAKLYWVPTNWASRILCSVGMMEQPVASLSADTSLASTITFALRDPRTDLSSPLQAVKYAGDNADGDGLEGDADLKGTPKPILYGLCSNVPGIKVNASKLIWQINDQATTILCVRDGGVPLTAGVQRANTASLLSNTPSPGRYDYVSGATGTYIRLGSTPIFQIGIDAESPGIFTHAGIWKAIRTDRVGTTDIDEDSADAIDEMDDNPVGFWWGADISQADAMNEVLTSLSGYEVMNNDGSWSIGKILAPSGATVVDLIQLQPDTDLTAKMRPIAKLNLARPDYTPNGAPPFKVNVLWGHNYSVMTKTQFAGAAAPRLVDKFAIEYRTEFAADATVWDPVAKTGKWPQAVEMTVNTGYQPGDDGLTCPHAVTEAARLLALYSSGKQQYNVTFTFQPGDEFQIGQVVSLTHPMMDLDGGPLFLVLQNALSLANNQATSTMTLGFQT